MVTSQITLKVSMEWGNGKNINISIFEEFLKRQCLQDWGKMDLSDSMKILLPSYSEIFKYSLNNEKPPNIKFWKLIVNETWVFEVFGLNTSFHKAII